MGCERSQFALSPRLPFTFIIATDDQHALVIWGAHSQDEQSQKPMLKMESRSQDKWQLLEGHTAFFCAQHLSGTVSNCCFLHGVPVTPSTCGVPLVLPVPLLSLLPPLLSNFMIDFLWALQYCLSV